MAERIIPASMQVLYDEWHFAPAVKVDNMLYLSGLIGAESDFTVSDDPEKQFNRVFDMLEEILTEAGGSISNVIEMTTYHVNLADSFPAFTAVKDKRMPEPHPAWTAIGVESLLLPGALVELKAIAQLNA